VDPNHLFFDSRLAGGCVYCGATGNTRDHVPSRVLLDEPFPEDLPVALACAACNVGFSLDEEYVACLIECVLCGSTDPAAVNRSKIRRLLTEKPGLISRIAASRDQSPTDLAWKPEQHRVSNVVAKLARGHAAFELAESKLDEPDAISFLPLVSMSAHERQRYLEYPLAEQAGWPEIGTRAFVRTARGQSAEGWIIVQPGRYRYLVREEPEGLAVQFILSEYLACRVVWS